MDRAAIEAEILALVEKHLAAFETYPECRNDPKTGHVARYTTEQGNRLTIAKYKGKGLSIDQIRDYYANIIKNAPLINPTYELTKIAEDQGHNIYHNLAKVPWPVTNRSTLACEYIREENGTYTYMATSKGCEHMVESQAKLIGKNVLALQIVLWEHYKPCEDGLEITCVTCVDPAGSLPNFLKNHQADHHADAPKDIANFLQKGHAK